MTILKAIPIVILVSLATIFYFNYPKDIRYPRKGYIVDKFISSPYEYHSGKYTNIAEAKMYVIFKTDSFGFLKIESSTQSFYSVNIGDKVTYQLSQHQIEAYSGN